MNTDPASEWRPYKRQEDFLRSPAREILFGGARGGGKTDAGIIWIALPAMRDKYPKSRGLVLRETAESLADWVDRASEIYCKTGARLVMTPTPRFVWPWGAKIFTGHLKDARSLRKYLGREFQRVLIEELTSVPDKDLYDKLLGSCRSTIKGLNARIAATTNPGGPGHHWVKKRFVDPAPPNTMFCERGSSLTRVFIPSLVTDNPALCDNDPTYIEHLDSLPEKLCKAWRHGDWSVMEGTFYTEFGRTTHTVAPFEIPDSWARYRAIDWGYWPDPCVCLWFAVSSDRVNSRIVLYRERHWTRTGPEDVAADILLLDRDVRISNTVADPSMWAAKSGPSDAEKMIQAGLPITQADNSRVQGWSRVHDYFKIRANGLPELKFFNTCVKSIESIEICQHDERNPMDIAANKLDHWADPIRYFCMSRPSRGRIKDKIPDVFSLKAMRYRKENNDG